MHLALKGVKKLPVPFPRADILGAMSAVICLLRGVNVVGNHKIKMEELRNLCEASGLLQVTTYIQSGNVVFRLKGRGGAALASRIETAIEAQCGFRPHVMLRTLEQMRDVVARNPFAKRTNIDPSKLLVYFLRNEPTREACDLARTIKTDPEELRVCGSEMYVYYLNGVGKSKLPIERIQKALGTSGTGRNWNTVTKLLELAEEVASA
jgi:uncharacterized protein (DUF1697 family)